GWFELRRQLEYKQAWRGGQVLAINPAYTSQQCACCGHTAKITARRKASLNALRVVMRRTPM
ncbi:zinc ribbon domain-containing protein, partial [Aeromonas caviae]|uniref:zinc ribbon domain-containing protein n=1 Tax=Aeromonas caviae TaxID=648 RepID=UPI001C8AFC0E